MAKKFISGAIKRKGSLRRYAEEHRLLDRSGLINLRKAHKFAQRHHQPSRLRQIHLAIILRKLRVHLCKDCPHA